MTVNIGCLERTYGNPMWENHMVEMTVSQFINHGNNDFTIIGQDKFGKDRVLSSIDFEKELNQERSFVRSGIER